MSSSSSSSPSSNYSDSSCGEYWSSYSSSMSTPPRFGVISVTRQIRSNVDGAARWDFDHLLHVNFPLDKFLKAVFGLTDKDMESLENQSWTLDKEGLAEYQAMVTNRTHETLRYQSFQAILNSVTNDDKFKPHLTDAPDCSAHFELHSTTRIPGGNTNRAPDGSISWRRLVPPRWELLKGALEVKVTPIPPRGASNAPTPQDPTGSRSIATTSTAVSSQAQSQALTPVASHSTTGKRRREDDDQALEAANKKLRTRRLDKLTKNTIQSTHYALECLATASRRWTIGLMVEDFNVTLWYFDRIGAVRTAPFDFTSEPWKLALVLVAFTRCSPVQAGFEPLIVSSGSVIDPQIGWPAFTRPLDSFENAELIVPKDIKKLSHTDTRYRIEGPPLYTYRGTIGRGTTVYPVTPLLGHYKTVPMVAKLSWPVLTRLTLEFEYVKLLRKRIPHMRKHLPKVFDSCVFSMADLNMPRSKFELPPLDREEPRQFTIYVMPRFKPIWELGCLEDFKSVFVDLVECHHHAYHTGKVLHRDLSENNLMWKYEEDDDDEEDIDISNSNHGEDGEGGKASDGVKPDAAGKSDRPGRAIGVLNDWDLASGVDKKGVVDRSKAKHRTGTQPFMAIDLLTSGPSPPPHLYRHDLESLLYFLIWAMAHYDFVKKRRRRTVPSLKDWEGDIRRNADSKGCIFAYDYKREQLFNDIQEQFRPLIDEWLIPLLDLFHGARLGNTKNRQDPVTLDGALTFETFMATIKRTPRPIPLPSE